MDSETDEVVLRTTGRALCAYGFVALTIKYLTEDSSLTTATTHSRFDAREGLPNAFLERSPGRAPEVDA